LYFRQIELSFLPSKLTDHWSATWLRVLCFGLTAAAWVIAPRYVHSQEVAALPAVALTVTPEETKAPVDFEDGAVAEMPAGMMTAAPVEAMAASGDLKPGKKPVESEIIAEGLVSYGNYKIFASGFGERIFTGGIEYDRHSWGYFLGAQVDYVAEFLPFVLLDKPLHVDIFGNPHPLSAESIRQYVPGVGISPIGFRMQWMSKRKIKPYLEAKGGIIAFTKKVPSTEATYENMSLQTGCGVQVKMNERWGLRLGLFSDLHFSNGFIVPVNPGLDVMNANLGISYHLGQRAK